jgi:MazG family protein
MSCACLDEEDLRNCVMNDEEMMHCDEPERQIQRLRAIMHRLRAPGGCPWDAEQTHESILTNMLEEAYECVDAIRSGDVAHMKEELGDVLLQVVFHSEIAQERGAFDFDDVAKAVSDKLVHRHPHVYGDSAVSDSDAVLAQWDAIKRAEKGDEPKPYLHRVGEGLPALMRAAKLQKKAAKVGFDWPEERGVMEKIREEFEELAQADRSGDEQAFAEELGDVLFSIVNLARWRGLDPELVLSQTNEKFFHRFGCMEQLLKRQGVSLEQADLRQMESAWQEAKQSHGTIEGA